MFQKITLQLSSFPRHYKMQTFVIEKKNSLFFVHFDH